MGEMRFEGGGEERKGVAALLAAWVMLNRSCAGSWAANASNDGRKAAVT